MNKSSWLLFSCLVLVLLVSTLSGCAADELPPEPVTITFVHQANERGYYESLVEAFKETYPEITVELTGIRGNNFNAYSEADVVRVNLFSFIQFQSQGAFLDLSPLIEQDKNLDFSDFYPGTVEIFSSDNKIWAIPDGIDTFVLYYNKELFDINGLAYPQNNWNWDDLLTAAIQIRNESRNQFGYAVLEEYQDINAMVLMSQHGGQLFDDLNTPSAVTYNHPLNIEAMQWYQDLYHLHNVAPTPDQASEAFGFGNQMMLRGVLQGDVGMWPGNFSDRGGATWPVEWDHLSWGVVALPGDLSAATSGFGTGYAITAQTQNPEAAWKWVVFLSEQIPQTLIPARRSLAESKEFRDRVGTDVAEAALTSVQNVTLISPDLVQFGGSLEYFSQAITDITNGDKTAKDALDWAQEQTERP